MKILITGAKGFIGKNLVATLKAQESFRVYAYDVDSNRELLDQYCKDADLIFHLAGVNRPKENQEFVEGNLFFTESVIDRVKKHQNRCPIIMSSSTQAVFDNPYGLSKKAAEDALIKYGKETNAPIIIYRLPNVFGKWSRPNYNSAVATFCYNIARDIPINISDSNAQLTLVYIDDVINELLNNLSKKQTIKSGYKSINIQYETTVGWIAATIKQFKENRNKLFIPSLENQLVKKLYSTYISFLPIDSLQIDLIGKSDERGSFIEFLKTHQSGQFSVNVCKPNITKGNHWHHSKHEKFFVIKGQGVIRLKSMINDDYIEYRINDQHLQIIDIPPGYTHNIENRGSEDLITIMWANEVFDVSQPDTYYREVTK
jgi:UDP-2-acetamido-2,6-beta-L-arabino-hexul-4-ose reductase